MRAIWTACLKYQPFHSRVPVSLFWSQEICERVGELTAIRRTSPCQKITGARRFMSFDAHMRHAAAMNMLSSQDPSAVAWDRICGD